MTLPDRMIDLIQEMTKGGFNRKKREELKTIFMQLFNTGGSVNAMLFGPTTTGLDADKLDAQHASYYRDATNINAGTLSTDRYSAYADLTAESKIGRTSTQVAAGNHQTHSVEELENVIESSEAVGDILQLTDWRETDDTTETLYDSSLLTVAGTANGSYPVANAFDGNKTNQWLSNASGAHYVTIAFPTRKVFVSKIVVTANSGDWMWADYPKHWHVYGSNTGAFGGEETDIGNSSAGGAAVTTTTFAAPRTAYQYYKITFPDNTNLRVNEIEVYTMTSEAKWENKTLAGAGIATHDAVTVTDTTTIDLTLSGQALSADVIPSGIDAADLGSGAADDGKVLTADGAGGAAWEDPAAAASLTVEEADGTPSVASVSKIKVTNGSLTDNGSGTVTLDFGSAATDGAAIHDNVASEIHAITEKTSIADNDEFIIEDSADSYNKKRVKKSTLGSGGGAPTDADYIVETANASLSAESVLGTTVITTAAHASRQAAAKAGRLFLPSDGVTFERDTGSAWVPWGPIFPLTPPVVGDFAWINQGSATADTTYGGIYLLAPAASGDNYKILKKAAPSTPYTITAWILPQIFYVNWNTCGLLWRQSSNGKMVHVYVGMDALNLYVDKADSPTSSHSGYMSVRINVPYGQPLCWRIADNGTNRIVSISADGQHFSQVHSVSRTDYITADEVGFFAGANNATYPAGINLLSWKEG